MRTEELLETFGSLTDYDFETVNPLLNFNMFDFSFNVLCNLNFPGLNFILFFCRALVCRWS